MAHKEPHRLLGAEIPVADCRRLDSLAARLKKSKAAILKEWLRPYFELLRSQDEEEQLAAEPPG